MWCSALLALLFEYTNAQVIGILRSDDLRNGYGPWVEQFGASVRVLPLSASATQVEAIFQSINALLLPGVTMSAERNGQSLQRALVARALQANRDGDFFPIWGTCKGYEDLLRIIGDARLDANFDAVDYPTPLALTASSPGRMLAGVNSSVLQWVANEKITYNNHMAGITPEHLASNAKLSTFFNVLGVSTDRRGRSMVELVEGKVVPIYVAQFHNEKVQFVPAGGQMEHIPKTAHAKAFAAQMGAFFVGEARKNKHSNATRPVAVA
jgi:gamma-glutamyl hydrolase